MLLLIIYVVFLFAVNGGVNSSVNIPTGFAAESSILPRKLKPRIAGGQETTISEHPYMLSLRYLGEHLCGGVILSHTRVLVAGHCIDGKPTAGFTIRVGSSYRDYGGKIINVREIFPHPKFDMTKIDYDVAVMVLESSISFYNDSKSIELVVPEEGERITVGTACQVVGWGGLGDSEFYSSTLQVATVYKVDDANCTRLFSQSYGDKEVCFGIDGSTVDTCPGDSGGPVVCNNALYATTSFGSYYCATKPAVYAKTFHPEVYKFIKSFL